MVSSTKLLVTIQFLCLSIGRAHGVLRTKNGNLRSKENAAKPRFFQLQVLAYDICGSPEHEKDTGLQFESKMVVRQRKPGSLVTEWMGTYGALSVPLRGSAALASGHRCNFTGGSTLTADKAYNMCRRQDDTGESDLAFSMCHRVRQRLAQKMIASGRYRYNLKVQQIRYVAGTNIIAGRTHLASIMTKGKFIRRPSLMIAKCQSYYTHIHTSTDICTDIRLYIVMKDVTDVISYCHNNMP